MLLSQMLIEKGKTAKPNNNMSMGNAAIEMHSICQFAQSEMTEAQIRNSVGLACEVLNKAGFPYYKPENIL
jgi:hypothetical protein